MNKRIRIFLIMVTTFVITIQMSNAAHYYCRLGQRPLDISDSILTIKFDPSIPGQDHGTFAQTVNTLDEAHQPVEDFRKSG